MRMALCVFFSCALCGNAQMIVPRMLQANETLYAGLRAFICDEQIERYRSMGSEDSKQIDTVRAKVAFAHGQEEYTDIFRNKKRIPTISSLPGAWSEGEYGTLLRQTKELIGSRPLVFLQNTTIDKRQAAIYSFDVEIQSTPWQLIVSGKSHDVPFRTYLWIAQDSAQILKIARVSTHLPAETGIAKITWFITLASTDMSGQSFLVPKTGQYAVAYEESDRNEWNAIRFTNYHRFGIETILRFGQMQ